MEAHDVYFSEGGTSINTIGTKGNDTMQREEKNNKPKLISYTRCSTEKEAQDSSMLTQSAEINAWAEHNGFEVIGSFSDRASGRSMERDGLLAALALANNTGASVAIVELSRLSRSVGDVANLLNANTRIILTRSGRSLSKEMVLIMAVFAEAESDAISRRTKAGIAAAFERDPNLRAQWGRASDPSAPADLVRGKIEAANRFALVYGPIAWNLRESGKSFRKIAEYLMAAKIPTPRGKANWTKMGVKRLVERYDRIINPIEPEEPEVFLEQPVATPKDLKKVVERRLPRNPFDEALDKGEFGFLEIDFDGFSEEKSDSWDSVLKELDEIGFETSELIKPDSPDTEPEAPQVEVEFINSVGTPGDNVDVQDDEF